MAGPRITDQMMYELPRWLKLLATGFVQSVGAGFGITITGTATNPVVNVNPAVIATPTRNYTTANANASAGIFAVYKLTNGTVDVPTAAQATQDLVFGLAVGPWLAGAQLAVTPSGQKLSTAPAKTGKLFSLPGGVLGNVGDLTPGNYTKSVGIGDSAAVEALVAAEAFQV